MKLEGSDKWGVNKCGSSNWDIDVQANGRRRDGCTVQSMEKAADDVPVVEKRRFANKATWTPSFCDTGNRHNFKEKYHYAFL
eukprot:2810109-Rhodomonas_salina.1